MTNLEIIATEAVANEIYTKDEILERLEAGMDLGLHTYQEWKRLGYQVQKGSKALFKTKIWKPRKGAKVEELEKEESIEIKKKNFIMVNASFFGINQVMKIEN